MLNTQKETIGLLNIAVVILSVYVLGTLIVDTMFALPEETTRLLEFIDNVICGFFLFEFGVRLYRAEDKWKFMKWGWIDLISSIPALPFLRTGRMLRLIRLLRILRALRSTRHLVYHVFRNKTRGLFSTVAMLASLMLIFSSLAILQVENTPESNIKTAEDALWWAYVTITTVGYGDKYPVTTEGRLIAIVLMTTGVGLFGTFTAFVSSWLVEERGERKE